MGAALVDLFADVDEPALDELGSPKGSMTLVDAARADTLRAGVEVHTYRPGGSAARYGCRPCRAWHAGRVHWQDWR